MLILSCKMKTNDIKLPSYVSAGQPLAQEIWGSEFKPLEPYMVILEAIPVQLNTAQPEPAPKTKDKVK